MTPRETELYNALQNVFAMSEQAIATHTNNAYYLALKNVRVIAADALGIDIFGKSKI